jgi:hypothetical protein
MEEEIQSLTSKLTLDNPLTASAFVNIDAHEETEAEMSDGDIVSIATGQEADESDEEDEAPPPPPVTNRQCQEALDTVLRYCEENAQFGLSHLTAMRSASNDITKRRNACKKQGSIFDFLKTG